MREGVGSFNVTWHSILILLCLYVLANSLYLFAGNSVYWDGYTLTRLYQHAGLLDYFQQLGFPQAGYLHQTLIPYGTFNYKLINFACYFISGIFLYGAITESKLISSKETFWIVALFLVLPFNVAKISSINIFSALSYCLFFAGWRLWVNFEISGKQWIRIVSLFFFALSFGLPSLLVFYIWPFLHYLFIRQWRLSHVIRRLDYVLLPFICFVFYKLIGAVNLEYETYNQIRLTSHVISTPILMAWNWILFLNVNVFVLGMASFFVAIVMMAYPSNGKGHEKIFMKRISPKLTLFIGILISLSAIAPYLLVVKFPFYTGWASRHQLLLPLGISVIIVGMIHFAKAKAQPILMNIALSLSIACSIGFYYDYLIDAVKQDALVLELATTKAIEQGKLFSVVDHTSKYNAMKRQYGTSEYEAILNKSINDGQVRLAHDLDFGGSLPLGSYDNFIIRVNEDLRGYFGVKRPFIKTDIDCELHIKYGSYLLTGAKAIKAIIAKVLHRDKYEKIIQNVLLLECRPLVLK